MDSNAPYSTNSNAPYSTKCRSFPSNFGDWMDRHFHWCSRGDCNTVYGIFRNVYKAASTYLNSGISQSHSSCSLQYIYMLSVRPVHMCFYRIFHPDHETRGQTIGRNRLDQYVVKRFIRFGSYQYPQLIVLNNKYQTKMMIVKTVRIFIKQEIKR